MGSAAQAKRSAMLQCKHRKLPHTQRLLSDDYSAGIKWWSCDYSVLFYSSGNSLISSNKLACHFLSSVLVYLTASPVFPILDCTFTFYIMKCILRFILVLFAAIVHLWTQVETPPCCSVTQSNFFKKPNVKLTVSLLFSKPNIFPPLVPNLVD